MIRELLTCAFLLLGAVLTLVAAAGVLRMPDLFIRMHAATKAGTVGVSSIAVGLMIHFNTITVTSRGVLVIAFFLLTAPVAAHMIARAAYRSGVSLWMLTRVDEWKARGKNDPGPA